MKKKYINKILIYTGLLSSIVLIMFLESHFRRPSFAKIYYYCSSYVICFLSFSIMRDICLSKKKQSTISYKMMFIIVFVVVLVKFCLDKFWI